MSLPHFAQGRVCGRCRKPFTSEPPASLDTGTIGMRCVWCMLILREEQLAECTRVMREACTALRDATDDLTQRGAINETIFFEIVEEWILKLRDARAGVSQ